MKSAIILHGMPSKKGYYNPKRNSQSNEHWIPWLQHQLILNNILAQTPELPKPYKPNYLNWCKVFNQFNVNKQTVLIGHSCGGGFLVRWLSENKTKIDKLVLVAPWIDPDKTLKNNDFFKFSINKNLQKLVNKIHILVSNDDDSDILKSVKQIKQVLPNAQVHNFKNMGHFCYGDLKTNKFPKLLQIVLKG